MPIVLGLGATTATSQSFTFAGWGASGTIDLQISPDPDFEFAVGPVYTGIPRATPYVAPGLNQAATYYARARTRLVDGSTEAWSNVVAFRTPLSAARSTAVAAILVEPAIIMRPERIISYASTPAAIAGFPVENVGRDAPVATRIFSDGLVYHFILEHAGAPVDTIAVLQTNLPESATLEVRGAATRAAVEAAVPLASQAFRATPNMPGRPGYHGLVQLGAPVSHRFFMISMAVPGGLPGSIVHVEHIVIGLNRKSKNHALEKTETPINMGSKDRTRTGAPDVVKGLKMRRVEFDLAWLTETISETLYHEIGGWLDETVLVVPNSKAGSWLHDRILLGDLKTARTTQPSSLHYTRTLAVESII